MGLLPLGAGALPAIGCGAPSAALTPPLGTLSILMRGRLPGSRAACRSGAAAAMAPAAASSAPGPCGDRAGDQARLDRRERPEQHRRIEMAHVADAEQAVVALARCPTRPIPSVSPAPRRTSGAGAAPSPGAGADRRHRVRAKAPDPRCSAQRAARAPGLDRRPDRARQHRVARPDCASPSSSGSSSAPRPGRTGDASAGCRRTAGNTPGRMRGPQSQ